MDIKELIPYTDVIIKDMNSLHKVLAHCIMELLDNGVMCAILR